MLNFPVFCDIMSKNIQYLKEAHDMNQLSELLYSISNLLSSIAKLLSNPLVLFFIIILICNKIIKIVKKKQEQIRKEKQRIERENRYKEETYYKITQTPYALLEDDTGKYGEYLIYKYLEHFENKGGKFLFNLYLPKDDGKTTEIDVILICAKGIFVFESKNYSGWIFGDESQINWTQTLPNKHKEHFYNPIMQNKSHIKHLRKFIDNKIPINSIIVFSDRCTLKNISLKSKDISVINRYRIDSVVSSIYNQEQTINLSETEINDIYNKLYPFTQVNSEIKAQHIANLNETTVPSAVSVVSTNLIAENKAEEIPVIEVQESPQTKVVSKESSVEATNSNTQNTEPLKCPKCGSDLVLRTARYGQNIGNQFYGCSKFPKCKYTQDIILQEECISD